MGAVATTSRSARADPPTVAAEPVRLVLTVAAGAEGVCPHEPELKDAVIARLGYDPFALDARRVALVDITSEHRQLTARVRLIAQDGVTQGSRELEGGLKDCTELFESVALALAIAIDPFSTGERRPPAAAVERPAAAAEPSALPVERPATPEPREVGRIGLGLLGAVGSGPSPTAGLSLAGELSLRERFRVGLEARIDLPTSDDGVRGRVVSSLLVADVLACYGWRLLACAVLTGGVARVTSTNVDVSQTVFPSFAAAGVRAAFDVVLGRRIAVRPYIEGEVVATRHTLRIDGEPRFTYAPFMGAAGLTTFFAFSQ